MQTILTVFLGAGLGGFFRHVLNGWVSAWLGTGFPFGILLINVLGSMAMGLVAGWFAFAGEGQSMLRLFLATGVLGGFTTFSAFSLDTVLLIERGEIGLAALYVGASVGLSVLGLCAGLWAMRVALG